MGLRANPIALICVPWCFKKGASGKKHGKQPQQQQQQQSFI